MHTLNHLKKLFLSFVLAWGVTASVFGVDLWQLMTDGETNPNLYIIELENSLPIDVPLPPTLFFSNHLTQNFNSWTKTINRR